MGTGKVPIKGITYLCAHAACSQQAEAYSLEYTPFAVSVLLVKGGAQDCPVPVDKIKKWMDG